MASILNQITMRLPNLKEICLGASMFAVSALPMKAYASLINGVNYDDNGGSEVIWTDDGSYGIQVDNHLDINGNVRIFEFAKVNDSNFTRDSFTLNSDYAFSPLNNKLIDAGIVGDVDEANSLYNNFLNSAGTLDSGNGWSLVNNGDGTDNINNSGEYIFGNPQWKVPTLGDYAVRERSVSASEFTNGSVIDDILVNGNLDPYMQICFDDNNTWNLRSTDGGAWEVDSTGVAGQGIQVVPEPVTIGLLGLGGLVALGARRLNDYSRRY